MLDGKATRMGTTKSHYVANKVLLEKKNRKKKKKTNKAEM